MIQQIKGHQEGQPPPPLSVSFLSVLRDDSLNRPVGCQDDIAVLTLIEVVPSQRCFPSKTAVQLNPSDLPFRLALFWLEPNLCLGVDSPFFSTIVVFKNQLFPLGF